MRAGDAGCVEDDIGCAQERVDVGMVRGASDQSLPRVPRECDVAVEDVALGRHDAMDVRAEVSEHARGAGCRIAAKVDDADAFEEPFGQRISRLRSRGSK